MASIRPSLALALAIAWLLMGGIGWSATKPQKRGVHVFVALADNQHQGIVPVPPQLGNGLDPANNLYWGAAFGVKTFFARSAKWQLLGCEKGPTLDVLQRCTFQHRVSGVELVADAYRGDAIAQAITDFVYAAGGTDPQGLGTSSSGIDEVVVYVGHDGLMDFQLSPALSGKDGVQRRAIILACASRQYFRELLRQSGAYPLLWTTGLMAPEAYTLEAALEAWIAAKGNEEVRESAAAAYSKYQKSGLQGARRLFVTGW